MSRVLPSSSMARAAARSGSLLERIALHQTRLRTPGLALDASGVALGARGLVLLPTIERLVAFLSIYTRERSFADLLAGSGADRLEVLVLRSPLGTREVAVCFPAASTTLLDVVADVARLAGALTFTGTGRYWVQYRDRSAPFGYDAVELLRVEQDTDFALHHSSFTQVYSRDRAVDLTSLVARLEPRRDPTSTALAARPLWVTAEAGIAAALVEYLARSGVDAEAGVIELAAESSFDDGPRRVWVLRIAELPPRLEKLVTATPGLRAFAPAGPGVAVQIGFRHPIHLMGLPVFPAEGLALLPGVSRGEARTPIVVDRVPQLAHVVSLVDVRVGGEVRRGTPVTDSSRVTVPLQLAPSVVGARGVTASLVPMEHAALLRRLAYALPTSALEAASLARVRAKDVGEFLVLRIPTGVDAIPLGWFFSERAPGLFVLAGHDLVPACTPQHLAAAVGATGQSAVFVMRTPGEPAEQVHAFSLDVSAFVPLASALVEPESWGALAPVEVVELMRVELEEKIGTVEMAGIGVAPLAGALSG
jgi:hypothetical protein